jgi:hypothetical protein
MSDVVTSRIPILVPAGPVWSSLISVALMSGVVASQAPVSAKPAAVVSARTQAARSAWQFIPESGKPFTDAGSGTCH